MKQFSCVFICLLAGCLAASAETRAQFPWWNSPIASELLTPAQTQRIRQIVHSYREKLFDSRNEVQKAEAALDEVMNDNPMSAENAKPVINRVAQARANSALIFLEMSTRIREVLTYEQWKTLVKRWEEVRGKQRPPDTAVVPQ